MKDKMNSLKEKVKAHKDDIVFYGTIAGAVALYAGFVVVGVRSYNKQLEEYKDAMVARRKLMSEALSRGAQLLPNNDGSFWIIEKDGKIS